MNTITQLSFVSMDVPVVVMACPPARAITEQSLYWDGFNAYCAGAQLEDMQTTAEQRGWWFANKCQGEAEAYEDDMLDREYWSRGTW